MFTNVDDDLDQFAYIGNVCLFIGFCSSMFFLLVINEPELVKSSKKVYDKYFTIAHDEVDE